MRYLSSLNWVDIFFILFAVIVTSIGIYFSSCSFNSLGLVLNISGFILLLGFGLPSRFSTNWDINTDRYKVAKIVSIIGVLLIITGFTLQYLYVP
jgi:hypothetical protein